MTNHHASKLEYLWDIINNTYASICGMWKLSYFGDNVGSLLLLWSLICHMLDQLWLDPCLFSWLIELGRTHAQGQECSIGHTVYLMGQTTRFYSYQRLWDSTLPPFILEKISCVM